MRTCVLAAVCFLALGVSGLFAAEQDIYKRMDLLDEKIENLRQSEAQRHGEERKNIDELKKRVENFDSYLHRQKGLQSLEVGGFKFGLGGTFIMQGGGHANAAANGDSAVLAPSFSTDITAERELGQIGGDLFLHLEAGRGLGVEDDIDVFSNVNRDVDNTIWLRPTELWYDQVLFSQKFSLKLGMLDPTVYFDTNEAANDETTQFIGRTFRNDPAGEFPVNNALGFRLAALPASWLELSYGLFDANTNWDDFSHHLFQIGEIKFRSVAGALLGNYRLIAWYNGLDHTKWLDPASIKNAAFGFALSFDQDVAQHVKLFARYGWQNPGVYNPVLTSTDGTNFSIGQAWSGGASLSGALWGRENDTIGAGVAQVFPSGDYKNANPAGRGKPEFHAELYYSFFIIENLVLTPDFQLVGYPFGGDAPRNRGVIYLGALRVQADF